MSATLEELNNAVRYLHAYIVDMAETTNRNMMTIKRSIDDHEIRVRAIEKHFEEQEKGTS
jgi:hypothetical protein